LKINPVWEASIRNLASHTYDTKGVHARDAANRPQWGIDEDYTTKILDAYPDRSIFYFLPRYHLRIDRGGWIYDASDIKLDVYGDCHSVRPLSDPENRAKVNALLALLI
jgi:hypothetical protein